jgi:hypothetical protein
MTDETNSNQKFLRGGLNQWISGSVGQWVSSMIGKCSYEPLIMMQRPHPETNENKHKRFAQHIGPPCHGTPGDEERPPVLGSWRNLYLLVLGNLLFWIVLFTLFTWMFK